MTTQIYERASAYLAKMPPAISGQGGHAAAFAVAVALTRGFNLSVEAAMPIFQEWNATCEPHWTDRELLHKLNSANAESEKQPGYLLNDGEPLSFRLPSPRPASAAAAESEGERKARERKAWPAFEQMTRAELESVAALRNLPFDALDIAHKAGLLRRAHYDKHECFIMAERDFAQARRFDGEPFTKHDGTKIKAKNLKGCEGAFIGARLFGQTPPILLVEGCAGLLEGIAAILMAERTDWTCLAAISAVSRFARAPELLAKLKGRRIHILADSDSAGMEAAALWCAELQAVGATVAIKLPPDGCKDLGEWLALNPSADELETIFAI